MTDLCSTVVTLTPTQEATFPANQGRAVYALFLCLVDGADTALAARLHEEAQVKPFTCSSPWRASPSSTPPQAREALYSHAEDGRRVRLARAAPGETWLLRCTTLTTELTRLWIEKVLPDLPAEVAFGEAAFRVQEATTSAGEHPWAGHISYADLASPYLLGGQPAPTRWRLDFASPIAFRSGGKTVPLPLPDLLFGSLLDRWNAWSPVALNTEVRRFAEECLAINRYRLRSRAWPGKGGAVHRGAVGRCEYVALNKDRYWCSTISTLAAFALYGGAGYQTTQGMGMCRWVAEG
jgi:CRISPR-associated endoribonuclease Cas6